MTESPKQLHARTIGATIAFDDWRQRIQTATDMPEVVQVVREYLAGWRSEQLKMLPTHVASTAIERSEDIVARAVIATREELQYQGTEAGHRLLTEMALTMAEAANRLRTLQARSRYKL